MGQSEEKLEKNTENTVSQMPIYRDSQQNITKETFCTEI